MINSLKKVCKITNNVVSATLKLNAQVTISGCKILVADGHYTKRHNKVCKYLHRTVFNEKSIPTKEAWLHEPEPVTANENVTIFNDKIIPSGRFIDSGAVTPDIVVCNKKEKSALIIHVSVPNDFGIYRAEIEKVTSIEVIPVIVGATGVMKDDDDPL